MQATIDSANRVIEAAKTAKRAVGALARLTTEEKNAALLAIAREIGEQAGKILAANRADLERGAAMVEAGEMTEAAYSRLKLDEAKVREIASGVEQVARLEDPVGKVTMATELDEGLRLYRVNCPIGVIGVVFESRPDALTQIASLAIKSGNAVLLKGGREAEHSNRALFDAVQNAALRTGIPAGALTLLESREEVSALLKAEGFVDLIIPRGSNALVRYVQENTEIPVLGHAEGICHIYVDEAADLDKAESIIIDGKMQYPSACNSVETVLIHSRVAESFLPRIMRELERGGVEVRLDEEAISRFGIRGVKTATEEDWKAEYCDLILSIKVVETIEDAIAHINTHSSHHTDAIVTEDAAAFDRFFAEVDSAGVYLNASTRFADGYRYGFGAEVGISTGKLHPRGPVGLEGLVTYKYKLTGEGHTVSMYAGTGARRFTHKKVLSAES
ncbi:MAG TPA: glutamate-5-semialdehyde dehydrogenase [Blastocatellia bacterium]|nr:glutamate-5-semialdehyde dehydrogenase [Blastocatellia bacterium]